MECPLKPNETVGSRAVDVEYLKAVVDAVPEDGAAWTYTHFTNSTDIPLPQPGKTVINMSADSVVEAAVHAMKGYPTVVTVPKSQDAKFEHIDSEWGEKFKFVRCPAEYREEANCSNCGGKGLPLCARGDRDYIIKFTAHGNQHKKVGSEQKGGCYGSGGPVAIQWRNTARAEQEESDAEKLTAWVKTLPKGTMIRHHVVGDLG